MDGDLQFQIPRTEFVLLIYGKGRSGGDKDDDFLALEGLQLGARIAQEWK